jgi:hypothetical protein
LTELYLLVIKGEMTDRLTNHLWLNMLASAIWEEVIIGHLFPIQNCPITIFKTKFGHSL